MASPNPPAGYPGQWEADVVLRDGGTCHLRPIRLDDENRLLAFHAQLSEETIYYRFFVPYPRLTPRDLERFITVDYIDRVALVALVRDELIGVVRYDRLPPNDAEVAFVIRDDYQGRGLGTIFLEHIAQAARERGVRRFVAEVLPANHRMIEVFEHAGYTPTSEYDDGVVHLEFDIRPTTSSVAVTRSREQRAEALSVHRLLAPQAIAVVGAGRDPSSVGHALVRHLVDGGFTGRVVAVNPLADAVGGVLSVASLTDIEPPVDLALVAVPAAAVADVIDDASRAGVHGLVVVSAGFSETGSAGWDAQRELVRRARSNGMRLVGPNALGLINTDPEVSLNASLSPVVPQRGPLGFFSQSGALGVALLDAVSQRRLGLSTFVSAGNRADISGNDLLQYWDEDPTTKVVMLYLESIGNPRKFSRIARRLGHHKPVIAVRAGRSTQGVPLGRAIRTSNVPPEAVEQMFRQSGVIRTDTVAQMFDVAELLTSQPLPGGNRVLALSNSDAMTLMAADAVTSSGMRWVDPPQVLEPDASSEVFDGALAAAVDDPAVDVILAMYVPTLHDSGESVADALARASAREVKPVVAVMFAVGGTHRLLQRLSPGGISGVGSVPAFPAVEDAVRALAAVTEHAEWRRSASGSPVDPPDIDVDRARAWVTEWLLESPDGGRLGSSHLSHLLSCYGVRVRPQLTATSADEAARAAGELGYPVVMKTADSHLRLRSDLGGIFFDIANEAELRHQFAARMVDLQPMDYDRLVVQQQVDPGVAVVLNSVEDPLFGPVLSFGISGVAYDLLQDRAYGIPPLTDTDVDQLLRGPRASSLLAADDRGVPFDLAPLCDLVSRISRLADDLPEVAHLSLRPIVVSQSGAAVLGAEAELRPPVGRTDLPARRLLG